MIIRPARLDDAPAIAVLTARIGYPNLPEETRARLRDVLDRPDGAVLAAEDEGSVAGWLYVFGIHLIETDPFALVAGLAVDGSRRNQGIGAALIESAAEWARQHGYRTLRVRSNVVREQDYAFYERLGFSRSQEQGVFVRSTDFGS